MWLAIILLGCKKVDPAPEALDDLFHYLWANYDEGSDEVLADGLVNLDAAAQGGDLDPPDGTISLLSNDEIALVGVTDRQAADASGVFMVNRFACSGGQLEEILSYGAQDELYEKVYASYRRDFDSPRDAWLAGDDALLGYDILYTADPPIGGQYDAVSQGHLRRVPLDAGDAIVQRSYLPKPADFEKENNSYVDQDYQLEMYLPAGGGEFLHVYAMWRDANFGGFSMDDTSFQRIVINNMYDWDDNTAELCAEGRP